LQRHDKRTIGMHWQIHKDSEPVRRARRGAVGRRGHRPPDPVRIASMFEPCMEISKRSLIDLYKW
ncbi:hypothetical protein ACWEQ8_16545, partial [Streptomyces noursei]